MKPKASLGARIRTLREARALTQAELADLCGVSQGKVGDWERGHYQPTAKSRRKLAEALGVNVESLAPTLIKTKA